MEQIELRAGACCQRRPKARFNRLRCTAMKVRVPRCELAPVTNAPVTNAPVTMARTWNSKTWVSAQRVAFSPARIGHGRQKLQYWRKRLYSSNLPMPVAGRMPLSHSFVVSGSPRGSTTARISKNPPPRAGWIPSAPTSSPASNHEN